jgi:hypothetical protein
MKKLPIKSLASIKHNDPENKKNIVFYFLLLATVAFFLWSRIDLSDRLYYFGDGTAVVALIHLMLNTGNWDPDWYRLVGVMHVDEDIKQLMSVSPDGAYFYNTAGYVMLATSICKAIYTAGFSGLSIQKILHGINLLVQSLTLLLLYLTGKQIAHRYVGLLSMIFFTLFPLALLEARYERIESWLCLLATALIYVSLRFQKIPKQTSFAMGVLIGLSIATKFSQLWLGIIPCVLLVHFFFSKNNVLLSQRLLTVTMYGSLIIIGIVLAIAINVPYILEHLTGYLAEIKKIQAVYASPLYPYAEEHYSYTGQLYVIVRYFVVTLGIGWILCFLAGCFTGSFHSSPALDQNARLAIINLAAPIVVLIFYFAVPVNFIERNFSSAEGFVCILSALGFYTVWTTITQQKISTLATLLMHAGIIIFVFYVPYMLDITFIQNHIKKTPHSGQTAFQNEMKQDFPDFWIKNLSHTHNITLTLPEKPTKAPRIYQIEDLNEHRAKKYIEVLTSNGFIYAAQYCSDFSSMPPNTFTIYHAAAKNNYFVREDEWPAALPADYFKTNCR